MQEPQETWIQSPGREDPLEEGMATHASVLAWRMPWTECRVGYGHRVAKSWTRVSAHTCTHTHIISTFQMMKLSSREIVDQRSLCRLVGKVGFQFSCASAWSVFITSSLFWSEDQVRANVVACKPPKLVKMTRLSQSQKELTPQRKKTQVKYLSIWRHRVLGKMSRAD